MLSLEELPEVSSFLGIVRVVPGRVRSVEVPSYNEWVLRSMGFGGYKKGFEVVVMFGEFTVNVKNVDRRFGAVGGEDS